MTERDRSLVEHLATRVKGWHPIRRRMQWCDANGQSQGYFGQNDDKFNWDPLGYWTSAGMVWEKAQAMPSVMNRVQEWLCRMNVGQMPSAPFLWFLEKASPRVLCEAVAWATGWEEHKVNE